MFAARLFPGRYFPRRYFPALGAAIPPTPTPTTVTAPAILAGGGRHHRPGWLARESWPREETPEEIGPDLVAMQRELAELRQYWQLKREALKGDIELIEQAVILLAGILND